MEEVEKDIWENQGVTIDKGEGSRNNRSPRPDKGENYVVKRTWMTETREELESETIGKRHKTLWSVTQQCHAVYKITTQAKRKCWLSSGFTPVKGLTEEKQRKHHALCSTQRRTNLQLT